MYNYIFRRYEAFSVYFFDIIACNVGKTISNINYLYHASIHSSCTL